MPTARPLINFMPAQLKMLLISKIIASLWAAVYSWPAIFDSTPPPANLEDCSTESSSKFHFQSAKLIPPTPEATKPLELYINYHNNYMSVNKITAHYKYYVNGIPMPEITEEVCSPDLESEHICPMPLGQHYIRKSFIVPNIGGKVEMKMEWRDPETSTTLLCIRAMMVFPVWQALRWQQH